MQDHNSSYPHPSADSPATYGKGAADTPVAATEPYVHPTPTDAPPLSHTHNGRGIGDR